jgi:hypothetical protein
MAVESPVNQTLVMTEEECAELRRILEQYLVDTHVERRRTDNHAYHERVVQEERVVKSLTEKVRLLGR